MKKKKISLIAALAVTFATSICASVGIWAHSVHAQETSEPILIGGEIKNEYILDEYLSVSDAQISCGGKTADAKVIVKKPDGELVQSTNVRLDMGGIYTIEYRAVIDGKLKTIKKDFTVQIPMFSGSSNNTYATYGVDDSQYNTGIQGVKAVLGVGDVLRYNDVIDLNESDGDFLEFFLLPIDGPGTIDSRAYTITLTDLHDSSNVLTVILQCYNNTDPNVSDYWFYDYTYVLAGGQNQIPTGFETNNGGKLHVGNEWGAPTRFSFYGMHGQNVAVGSETLKLTYDAESNTVYANDTKIIALDDLSVFEEEWRGFTTGEVKLTISGGEILGTSARMMITRIGKNKLNQTILSDVTAPEISVNYDGYDGAALPTAGKGYSYPVFDATAKDKMFGNVPVKATVYYNYESSQRYQVEIIDGKFKTDRTGIYTIEYLASDGYRNEGKVLVPVECKASSPAVSVDATGEYVTSAKTGELIFPANISYFGGTGKVETYATVQAQDGEEVVIDDGFRPENAGEYTITLYAVDMLGKTATYEYALTVEANEAPVFLDEVILPKYFLAGYNYKLPALCAYDYASGKEKIDTAIAVKDGGEEREFANGIGKFTADADGYATVIYKASGKLGNSQKEYKVPVIDAWVTEETIDMSKYFYGENITSTATNADIKVSATADASYDFITPMIAHKFEMQFSITGNAFERLQLVFADAKDENVKFTVEIDNSHSDTKNALLKINGVDTRYVPKAGFLGGSFSFFYDDVSKMLQDDGGLNQLIRNADGSVFAGFPSKKIYVTANYIDVTGAAEIAWTNMGGQLLSNNDMDTIKPSITIANEYESSYAYKTTCEIHAGIAADVLSPETTNTLIVYDPEGNVVKDLNGTELFNVSFDRSYSIYLDSYGSYSIVYTSVDAFGRERAYYYAVYVTDDIAPKIVLQGTVQEEVKLGKKINIVEAIAVDNVDGEVPLYTYLVTPSGIVTKVENGGKFVAQEKGVYEIRYMSIDTFGNLQLITYKVTVK